MRNRERGAAHVNIFFFIIMLVLFLGALFFGYAQMSENNLLKTAKDNALQEEKKQKFAVTLRDHLIGDLVKIVGEAGDYPGQEGFDYKEMLADAGLTEMPTLKNVPVPAKIKATLEAFGTAAKVPSSLKQLSDFLSAAKSSIDAANTKAADLDIERNKALADRAALEKANNDSTTARSADVAKLNQQHGEFRTTWDNAVKTQGELITNMRTQIAARDGDLEKEKQEHAADKLKSSKEANLLKGQISAQTAKMSLLNPPQDADGEIVSSSPSISRAWIDLGRKDMLQVGTTFRVTPRGKKDQIKAYAEVTKLEQDRAEVKISGLKDAFDPVVKGDQISNDLYGANIKRTIVLIGRFSYPLTKPTVKLLLENLGNQVVEKVAPGVDLVIVGGDSLNEAADGYTPVTETPEYKQALFLGVEIAPLHKVRDFLKLSD